MTFSNSDPSMMLSKQGVILCIIVCGAYCVSASVINRDKRQVLDGVVGIGQDLVSIPIDLVSELILGPVVEIVSIPFELINGVLTPIFSVLDAVFSTVTLPLNLGIDVIQGVSTVVGHVTGPMRFIVSGVLTNVGPAVQYFNSPVGDVVDTILGPIGSFIGPDYSVDNTTSPSTEADSSSTEAYSSSTEADSSSNGTESSSNGTESSSNGTDSSSSDSPMNEILEPSNDQEMNSGPSVHQGMNSEPSNNRGMNSGSGVNQGMDPGPSDNREMISGLSNIQGMNLGPSNNQGIAQEPQNSNAMNNPESNNMIKSPALKLNLNTVRQKRSTWNETDWTSIMGDVINLSGSAFELSTDMFKTLHEYSQTCDVIKPVNSYTHKQVYKNPHKYLQSFFCYVLSRVGTVLEVTINKVMNMFWTITSSELLPHLDSMVLNTVNDGVESPNLQNMISSLETIYRFLGLIGHLS